MTAAAAEYQINWFPLFSARSRMTASIADNSYNNLWQRYSVSVPAHRIVAPGLTKGTRMSSGGGGPPLK